LNSEDSDNYLREIRRVLKPSGKAFVTFYLINQTYIKYREVGLAKVTFDHGRSLYWVHDPSVPEAVSAYDEAYAFEMIRNSGLDIVTVSYGGLIQCIGWTFQDCLVVRPSRPLLQP
jgi:ubiquinone/menaquinone biosynthesis C-methylase UbiE